MHRVCGDRPLLQYAITPFNRYRQSEAIQQIFNLQSSIFNSGLSGLGSLARFGNEKQEIRKPDFRPGIQTYFLAIKVRRFQARPEICRPAAKKVLQLFIFNQDALFEEDRSKIVDQQIEKLHNDMTPLTYGIFSITLAGD